MWVLWHPTFIVYLMVWSPFINACRQLYVTHNDLLPVHSRSTHYHCTSEMKAFEFGIWRWGREINVRRKKRILTKQLTPCAERPQATWSLATRSAADWIVVAALGTGSVGELAEARIPLCEPWNNKHCHSQGGQEIVIYVLTATQQLIWSVKAQSKLLWSQVSETVIAVVGLA